MEQREPNEDPPVCAPRAPQSPGPTHGRSTPVGPSSSAAASAAPTGALERLGLRERARESRWWGLVSLLGAGAVMASGYLAANEFAAARGVTVFDPGRLFVVGGGSLDARIPYVPWTVLVYTSLFYASFPAAVLLYPKTDAGVRDLFGLLRGLVVITLAACAVFVAAPAEMTLRAEAVPRGDSTFWHQLNLWLRAVDRPFNTWPCLHVAQSGLVALTIGRWLDRRGATIALWVAWGVLAVSTLTTKQHFLWDLVTGTALAAGYWGWKLRPDSSRQD